MQGAVSYAALGPRERSIVDAFAAGDEWSPDYYKAWLRNRTEPESQAIRLAFAGDDPDKAAEAEAKKPIEASLIRALLFGKVNEQGQPIIVDERGAHMRNAAISGELDLSVLEFRKPIVFEKCTFDNPIILRA